jgi:hypothetical protein
MPGFHRLFPLDLPFSMNFSARLQQLPAVTHLAALQLADTQGQVVATIENKPGQTGSLAVYHALAALYGGSITPAAAGWAWSGMPSTRRTPSPFPASTPISTACWPGPRVRTATRPA